MTELRLTTRWYDGWRHPLVLPLLAGAGLRIFAAWSGHGIFASDDYTHVIEMAARWLDDPDQPFNSRIRSELMARLAWAVFLLARACGVTHPANYLHVLYTALGIYSLVAIPGVYALTKPRFGESAARNAAWLMAAEAVMPRLSTRALISMASIPPLVWGLVYADRVIQEPRHQEKYAFFAGGLIAVASLFRFQVGLLYLTGLFVVLWYKRRSEESTQATALPWLAGGLIALCMQIALDLHAFGSWVPAPIKYIQMNLAESSGFGIGPWFSYFGMFLLLTLPPATFALAPGIWRTARTQRITSIGFMVFFTLHSLIPHKEERFLFPLLPLFFVALAVGLNDAWRSQTKWKRSLVRYFWIVNAVLLIGASLSDASRNITTPMLEAERRGDISVFYGVGHFLFPVFYLGNHGIRGQQVSSTKALFQVLDTENSKGTVRVFFDHTPEPWEIEGLRSRGSCDTPFLSYSDPVDRLLVWINPIGNRHRRGPKTVIDCDFNRP